MSKLIGWTRRLENIGRRLVNQQINKPSSSIHYHPRMIPGSNSRSLATSVDPTVQTKSAITQDDQLNTDIRQAIGKLPARPTKLEDNLLEEQDSRRILDRSLDNGRLPIGSRYAQARSPVYLPNITLKLVRPSLGDRSDPYTAIFRCDLQLTKPDIFNYLRQIYGLGITSIRTAIYRGRYTRQSKSKVRGGVTVKRDQKRTFKKVWIGLDRPFFYPNRPTIKFLDEQYMYSDILNSYNRSKLFALEQSQTDRRQVLPSGMQNKGDRKNVLREILNSKIIVKEELKQHLRKSLKESNQITIKDQSTPKS